MQGDEGREGRNGRKGRGGKGGGEGWRNGVWERKMEEERDGEMEIWKDRGREKARDRERRERVRGIWRRL